MSRNNDGCGVLILLMILAFFIGAYLFVEFALGIFPFGPLSTREVAVERLYVDYGENKSSSYMVGTSEGVFEVKNSFWLWMWDADDRYSQLKEGEKYRIQVKGNKVVGFLFQEYPVVIHIEKIEKKEAGHDNR
jgi:hypothetical protein